MLYKLFVQSLLSGSFALHSAKTNNHKIMTTHVLSPGHKMYKCIKNDSFLEKFGLEEWEHEEKICIINDTEVEITDILKWDICKACRTYIVVDKDNIAMRYVTREWVVEYNGMYLVNNFIAGKIKNSMISADLKAFDTFII